MSEPPIPTICGICREPATYPHPAKAGTIKAEPCGHVATFAEVYKAFPERMAYIMGEIDQAILEVKDL